MRSLLAGFSERLAFGVRAELTELVRLRGVDGARARAFHGAGMFQEAQEKKLSLGLSSLAKLAAADPTSVGKVLAAVVPFARFECVSRKLG